MYMKIKEEINYRVMDIVIKNEASFAFPSRTLYHEFGSKGIPLQKID
jgi:MscS family membrane protein